MLDTDDVMMITVAVGAGRVFRSIESPAAEVRIARVSQPPSANCPPAEFKDGNINLSLPVHSPVQLRVLAYDVELRALEAVLSDFTGLHSGLPGLGTDPSTQLDDLPCPL